MALALRSMHAGLCARLSSIELSDIRYRTYRHACHACTGDRCSIAMQPHL